MSSDLKRSAFMVDGYERARTAMELEVRREFESRFSEQWAAARIIRRWLLRRKINAEIERRLQKCAPDEALY